MIARTLKICFRFLASESLVAARSFFLPLTYVISWAGRSWRRAALLGFMCVAVTASLAAFPSRPAALLIDPDSASLAATDRAFGKELDPQNENSPVTPTAAMVSSTIAHLQAAQKTPITVKIVKSGSTSASDTRGGHSEVVFRTLLSRNSDTNGDSLAARLAAFENAQRYRFLIREIELAPADQHDPQIASDASGEAANFERLARLSAALRQIKAHQSERMRLVSSVVALQMEANLLYQMRPEQALEQSNVQKRGMQFAVHAIEISALDPKEIPNSPK